MRWYSKVAIAAVSIGAIIFVANLWFGPSGTGEWKNSPDGRFTAHAGNMSRGTVFAGRVRYIELSVVENTTGHEVWRVRVQHAGDAKVPDYGDRSQEPFIRWARDSTSVTIPVEGDRQVTLPMP